MEDYNLSELEETIEVLRRLKSKTDQQNYSNLLKTRKDKIVGQIDAAKTDRERKLYIHSLNVLCGAEKFLNGENSHESKDCILSGELVIPSEDKSNYPLENNLSGKRLAYATLALTASVALAYTIFSGKLAGLEEIIKNSLTR